MFKNYLDENEKELDFHYKKENGWYLFIDFEIKNSEFNLKDNLINYEKIKIFDWIILYVEKDETWKIISFKNLNFEILKNLEEYEKEFKLKNKISSYLKIDWKVKMLLNYIIEIENLEYEKELNFDNYVKLKIIWELLKMTYLKE